MCALIAIAVLSGHQSFEVASVRESRLPGGGWKLTPPGQVAFTSVPVRTILAMAFDVPLSLIPVKVFGGSPTILERLFTIEAKREPAQDSRAMLRALLAERLGLRTHTDGCIGCASYLWNMYGISYAK